MRRQFRNDSKAPDALPASGRGYMHVCPTCEARMELCDLRDGDQGYFCHVCQKGHRASNPPLASLRPLKTGADTFQSEREAS